jgi:hypothetical protein
VTSVRITKTKWSFLVSAWLREHFVTGEFWFNKETLEPDYSYFEYCFVNSEDAVAFRINFPE